MDNVFFLKKNAGLRGNPFALCCMKQQLTEAEIEVKFTQYTLLHFFFEVHTVYIITYFFLTEAEIEVKFTQYTLLHIIITNTGREAAAARGRNLGSPLSLHTHPHTHTHTWRRWGVAGSDFACVFACVFGGREDTIDSSKSIISSGDLNSSLMYKDIS